MIIGVHGDDLIVRLPAEATDAALMEPGTRPFDPTGRPMRGWLLVGPDAHAEDDDLRRWVDRGVDYADTLPPEKPPTAARPAAARQAGRSAGSPKALNRSG